MQGNGGGRDPFFGFGDPFAGMAGFGGFGGRQSLFPNIFGGRDPFDDPFFTPPFGGMFPPNIFGPSGNPFAGARASGFLEQHTPQPNNSRGPIIEELNSDDEKEETKEVKQDNPQKQRRLNLEPYVEVPDDETEGRMSGQIQYRNDFSRVNSAHAQPQTRSFTFQSSTVSYGGANGTYYSSSSTKRTGSDGLTIEDSKEANTATGQASHRLSRGIHDKGHTVSRKLSSDGRVDTMQTLHNLNEDELSGFEKTWNGNARKHLPGWGTGLNIHDASGITGQNGPASRGVLLLPSTEHPQRSSGIRSNTGERAGPSGPQHSGRMKADFGDGTGSRGRQKSSGAIKMDQPRRR